MSIAPRPVGGTFGAGRRPPWAVTAGRRAPPFSSAGASRPDRRRGEASAVPPARPLPLIVAYGLLCGPAEAARCGGGTGRSPGGDGPRDGLRRPQRVVASARKARRRGAPATMMSRRKLPIGIQTFREVREDDCYYVDKTAHVRRLVEEGKHYFLSRPRRFGKSLFLDTCKELFEGSEAAVRGARHSRALGTGRCAIRWCA